jgi:protein O-mannosyl-transferase
MSSSSSAAASQSQTPIVVSSSGIFGSPAKRGLLCSLLLVMAVVVAYSPVTHNRFIEYDDDEYITNNPHVRAGLTGTTVKWAFTTYDQANWHPLTWLSHALDVELFGLNPAAHHSINVLLHALNAVLLFFLLQSATGFRWRSLMVAALFALHPINVESVAWAAERKNVLSMMFFLLALYAYGWYARRPKLGRYAAVFSCFALSLLCKPQAITFPFLLLLWDYWPLRRICVAEPVSGAVNQLGKLPEFRIRWLVLEKMPFLLLAAASALVTMKAQKSGGAVKTLSQFSVLLRVETAVVAYLRYLGKAFWPSKLVALYPHPAKLYPAWEIWAAVLFLILISLVVAIRSTPGGGDHRYLAVGWFWFLGSLVPMIGLIQVGFQAMADRYAYIPFVGLFVMLVWLLADWAAAHEIPGRWVAPPAALCLLICGTLTYRQVSYWHDTPAFWERTLALTQDNYVAHDNLGEFLFTEDRREDAAAQFRAALAIRPDDLPANLNLGTYEHGRGNLAEAASRYQMVALNAGDIGLRATAYGNLGSVYRQMGELTAAKQCYAKALELVPTRTMAMIGLGLVAQKSGDLPEAVRQFSHAMSMQPTDVGYLLLAQALQQEGRLDEAKAMFERVARLSPNLADAQKTADSLLAGK